MISRSAYDAYDYHGDNGRRSGKSALCWQCMKPISNEEERFWIGKAPSRGKLSSYSYLYFHRQCFESIATEWWIVSDE